MKIESNNHLGAPTAAEILAAIERGDAHAYEVERARGPIEDLEEFRSTILDTITSSAEGVHPKADIPHAKILKRTRLGFIEVVADYRPWPSPSPVCCPSATPKAGGGDVAPANNAPRGAASARQASQWQMDSPKIGATEPAKVAQAVPGKARRSWCRGAHR
jgi:hypothetical protein